MIVLRRLLVLPLALVLVAAFVVALVLSRIDATVLQPGFYTEQLRVLGVYERFHDDVLPRLVADFLERQEEGLPEDMAAIQLPTDERSQRIILDLLRTAFPSEWLQAEAEAAIEAVVPYFTGRTDSFELPVRLGERLRAVAGNTPGEPSALQQAWRDLGLAERVIRDLVEAHLAEAAATIEVPEDGDTEGFLDAIAGDIEGASAWLETQLFGAIEEVVPYLLGEREHFRVVVRFDDYPGLAAPFSAALGREPDELLRDGFVLDDREIRESLADAEPGEGFEAFEERIAIFRPAGYTLTAARLTDSAAVGAEGDEGLDVERLRSAGTIVARARWGSIGGVALLIVAIGFLGGRTWPSRLAWGASALLFASVLAFALTGPAYQATASEQLGRALAEARPAEPGAFASLQGDLFDRVHAIADATASRMAATSRNWALLSLLAIAAAAGWALWPRRAAPTASAPPIEEGAAEPDSRVA